MILKKLAGIELKPCPFCGSNAVAHYIKDDRYHEIRVGCSKCWCMVEKTLGRWEEVDIKNTIKKWNTRAESEEGENE